MEARMSNGPTTEQPPPREGFVGPADDDSLIDNKPRPGPPPVITAEPEPEPLPAAEPPKEIWPIKVKLLNKPIRDRKNKLIHELYFREPSAADIVRCGNPARFNADGDLIVDERKMTMMISALGGVFTQDVEAMDTRDWNACAYRLRVFFIPDGQAYL